MQPNGEKPLSPEEQKAQQRAIQKALKEEFTLVFTREELLTIHQILSKVQLPFGEAMKLKPVIDKVEPIVTIAPDLDAMTKEELGKEVPTVIGAKQKESN